MMKTKFILNIFVIALFAASCTPSANKLLQNNKENYKVSRDEGHERNAKILKGIISRKVLQTDTAFAWFNVNYKYAQPDKDAVKAFEKAKDKCTFIVFAGTWCEDSQSLLPLFYKMVDASGFPESKIVLIGVDRPKTTFHNLHETYNIKNVPTFIVLQDGKEVDRVVEYGKTGFIDKELGEILSKLP